MKKTVLLAIVAACGLFTAATPVSAQGTAFTYQGNLNNGGSPVTGLYDFTFAIETTTSGASQVGSTLTETAVGVTNGLFTVTLDFDGGVPFNGSIYYLQIGVRTNGAPTFAPLSPRQQLTPTPYAITAENVDGTVLASQLAGTLPSGLFSGTYGSPVTLNNAGNNISGNISGNFSGSGTGLTGVALLASNNTFGVDQNINGRLKVSDGTAQTNFTDVVIGPGGYNYGEQHSINFDDGGGHIGSLNVGLATVSGANAYFSVGNLWNGVSGHTTNTTEFIVLGNGNVGIGTNNPQASLHIVSSNTTPQLQLTQLIPGNYSRLRFAPNTNGIWDIDAGGGAADVMNFYNGNTTSNVMTLTANGLGIGTTAPAAPLHVISPIISAYSGIPAIYAFSDGGSSSDVSGGFYTAAGEFSGANGVIGAASTNQSNGYGVIGLASGTGGRGVYGQASNPGGSDVGVYGESDSTNGGYGVYGTAFATNGAGYMPKA